MLHESVGNFVVRRCEYISIDFFGVDVQYTDILVKLITKFVKRTYEHRFGIYVKIADTVIFLIRLTYPKTCADVHQKALAVIRLPTHTWTVGMNLVNQAN